MITIIEGLDNCGKDILISGIKSNYNIGTTYELHCQRPNGSSNISQSEFQNYEFFNISKFLLCNYTNTIILNRSWIGEYVYGQIYRNRSKEDVTSLIYNIENTLTLIHPFIKLILLIPENIEFLTNHDDGNSLSKLDQNKIKLEYDLFNEVVDSVTSIKSKKIIISKDGEYRDKNEILKEALQFII